MTAHTAIIFVADNVPLGFKLSLQAILENLLCIFMSLSAFIVLCLPLLCSVATCIFRDTFLCDCTCCHAEDYKNWCILFVSVRFAILCAEVLLLLKPLWYSSLRCMLTTIWLSNSTFVTL